MAKSVNSGDVVTLLCMCENLCHSEASLYSADVFLEVCVWVFSKLCICI